MPSADDPSESIGPVEVPHLPYPGKAAALAWLYYHLVSYGSSFVSGAITLDPYFTPMDGWAD
jgi:hypothetical protein